MIDLLNNPAPWGPSNHRDTTPRRNILSLHRRRRRQAIKSRIRDARREAANQPAPLLVPAEKRIDKMTRDELRAECKARGLNGYGHLNKAGLLALLAEKSR